MSKIAGIVIFMGLAAVLQSCMLDAKIVSLTPAGVDVTVSKVTTSGEFVSGYQPPTLSNGLRYQKKSVVGLPQAHLVQKSSVRGYKVYMAVEGQMLSDELK